jgi:hypothetical protein
VRLYSAASEETLRARKFLTDWAGEGLLTKEQYRLLEQETVSELRTTNIFLRLVLFPFHPDHRGCCLRPALVGF